MLERTAPGVFHAVAGQTVTLAAVSRNNDGVAAAAFRYGSPDNLPQRQVQGHPGCTFEVGAGPRVFTMSVFFVPGLRGARYELVEEDGGGTLTPLGVTVSPASGPVVQVQIDGRPKPAARAARKPAAKAARKPAAKAARKPAAKAARKPAAKVAPKPAAKAAPKVAAKAVPKRPKPRMPKRAPKRSRAPAARRRR